MHEPSRSAGTGRRAQTLVEFAIVLPLLITVLFAIIEMSYTFFQTLTVQNATRAAARQGAVGKTDATLRNTIKGLCENFGITDSDISIVVTDSAGTVQAAGTRPTGGTIKVTTTHRIMFLTFLSSVMAPSGTLQIKPFTLLLVE